MTKKNQMHNGHFRADEPSGRSACVRSMTWDGKNLNAWATPNYELTTMLYRRITTVSAEFWISPITRQPLANRT